MTGGARGGLSGIAPAPRPVAIALLSGASVLAAFATIAAWAAYFKPQASSPQWSSLLPAGCPLSCHSPIRAVTLAGAIIRLAAAGTRSAECTGKCGLRRQNAFADIDPPLWEGLGSLTYKITTANPLAQRYFDQGLRLSLMLSITPRRSALSARRRSLTPRCGICFWGEALVLGPNINEPMTEAAVRPAFAAVRKAQELAAFASARRTDADRRVVRTLCGEIRRRIPRRSMRLMPPPGAKPPRSFPTTTTSPCCMQDR